MSARVTPKTALVGRPSGADIGPTPWNIWKIIPWASSRYRLPTGGVSDIGTGTFAVRERGGSDCRPGSCDRGLRGPAADPVRQSSIVNSQSEIAQGPAVRAHRL